MGGNVTIQGKLGTNRTIVQEIYTTNNAAWVTDKTGPQGDHPNNLFTTLALVSTAAALTTVTGLQGMHSGQFNVIANGGIETLSITALSDTGANMGPIIVEVVVSGVTAVGTQLVSTALPIATTPGSTYRFKAPLTCAGLVFTKSAAVQQFTMDGFISGAS